MARTCAVEAQRCVDCVSAVCTRCLYAQRLSGRISTPTGVLGVPGAVADEFARTARHGRGGGVPPLASALGGQSGIDRNPASRLVWADNLKVLLITLIIALHGVLSYSATLKVWTYSPFREVTLHPVTEGVLFVIVTPIGFLTIPLLFLVAGLFTPGSLERKGVRRFVADRLLRLGVPFAVFVFLLQPTLTYALAHPLGDAPGSWTEEYLGAGMILDTGPMWFVGVLLIYSLTYAAWVAARHGQVHTKATISFHNLLALAGLVAVTSFLVRLVYPFGSEAGRTDLQFWEWPATIAVFVLGVIGWDRGWLRQMPKDLVRLCRNVALTSLAAMAALLFLAGFTDRIDEGLGGWHWLAAVFAAIEAPLILFGSIWLIALAQRRLDRHYRGDAVLNRICYAAFIVQGFVLIGLAAALRPLSAPAEFKALIVMAGGIAGSFGLAWLLVRIPVLRQVL